MRLWNAYGTVQKTWKVIFITCYKNLGFLPAERYTHEQIAKAVVPIFKRPFSSSNSILSGSAMGGNMVNR